MFTGLVQAVGTVRSAQNGRFLLDCPWDAAGLALGASISCDGCCLTATGITPHGSGSAFTVDVSNETLSRTTLGEWGAGRRFNLERSLRAGDELGGHLVTGHVDGLARIESVEPSGFSKVFTIAAPPELAKFIAPKGSIALDGTSLTVNTVEDTLFTVNLIPHTLEVTTWRERGPGDLVNLEVDLIARYVARLVGR
jgi:riboflavin synthase